MRDKLGQNEFPWQQKRVEYYLAEIVQIREPVCDHAVYPKRRAVAINYCRAQLVGFETPNFGHELPGTMVLRRTPNCDAYHILIRQILVNQQGFEADFDGHGLPVDGLLCLKGGCLCRN